MYAVVNEALTPLTFKSVILDNKGMVKTYNVEFVDSKEMVALPSDTKFYGSEKEFREGEAIIEDEHNIHDSIFYSEKHDSLVLDCWMMKDGEPKNGKVLIDTITYPHGEIFSISKHVTFITKDPNFKFDGKKVTLTRDECLAWNDYKVRQEDGTEVIRKGVAKALALTPEQEALKSQLLSLMNQMKEADIRMFYYDGELSFFNIKDYDVDSWYEGEQDSDYDTEVTDYRATASTPIWNDYDDNRFYAKPKETK